VTNRQWPVRIDAREGDQRRTGQLDDEQRRASASLA
jgi:hypothetical protein